MNNKYEKYDSSEMNTVDLDKDNSINDKRNVEFNNQGFRNSIPEEKPNVNLEVKGENSVQQPAENAPAEVEIRASNYETLDETIGDTLVMIN